jgi:hypothetical protein
VTVDEALDELYGAPLADFVATRKRLAKELDGDEAKAFAKLRKPSTAAWVLNQLARHNRREVDLLLDAGHRLRQAQAGVLRGEERKAFEQARHTEADALQRLLKAAQELGASGAALTAVNEGLRAAAITEEGRELLALGRFVEPPKAAGLEAFAGIDVPERASARPKKDDAPRKSDERREAATALRELEHRLHAAEREAEQAEKQAQKARQTADALAREVAEAERRLRELRG